MQQVNVRIDDTLISRLERLIKRTGRTKSFYVKEALKEHLEDLEDIYIAKQRLDDVCDGKQRLFLGKP
ncbi:hypothetical protein AGMMS50222_10770 [Endomicrobiia bacterium]|nr:hypothetical protein AGMMS49531_09310 [Endomicrobiia bacterium]GHT66894.1 hypothetical protein AGMMS49556_08210 [Endomicrobiia bacterium]GHT77338.1 hypothetical protein AGMMS50222_10770 [Endomicrobiia bacterium]